MRRLFHLLAVLLSLCSPAGADEVAVPPPPADAVCPVCGMFVAKYPEWTATVVYKDGHSQYFDGAKDLFKFLFAMPRYAPGHSFAEVSAMAVTDYYDVRPLDARAAFYVIGSDVLAPMGHDLVPLATRAEADDFVKDHKGRAVLTFEQVTPEVIRDLDGNGRR